MISMYSYCGTGCMHNHTHDYERLDYNSYNDNAKSDELSDEQLFLLSKRNDEIKRAWKKDLYAKVQANFKPK